MREIKLPVRVPMREWKAGPSRYVALCHLEQSRPRPQIAAALCLVASGSFCPAGCNFKSAEGVTRSSRCLCAKAWLYSPAAARSVWILSVRSHVNSGSSRPKCPYAAVFS